MSDLKCNDESTLNKDSLVHLIYHDPSDLGSLILIRIIPKESFKISVSNCSFPAPHQKGKLCILLFYKALMVL